MRQVILYPGEIGYRVAECPSHPGCVSQGKTKEDTIQNIRKAIEGYVLTLQEEIAVLPDRFDSVLSGV
jgi:predicted RNase H-like HicB family nuclease